MLDVIISALTQIFFGIIIGIWLEATYHPAGWLTRKLSQKLEK